VAYRVEMAPSKPPLKRDVSPRKLSPGVTLVTNADCSLSGVRSILSENSSVIVIEGRHQRHASEPPRGAIDDAILRSPLRRTRMILPRASSSRH
jgi:hypothetical protein